MIKGKFIDVNTRTIAGRHYVVRPAHEIQKGEAIWTQTPDGFELWTVENVNANTKRITPNPINLSGIVGFIMFETAHGSVMHDANGGVYVDIKRGK